MAVLTQEIVIKLFFLLEESAAVLPVFLRPARKPPTCSAGIPSDLFKKAPPTCWWGKPSDLLGIAWRALNGRQTAFVTPRRCGKCLVIHPC